MRKLLLLIILLAVTASIAAVLVLRPGRANALIGILVHQGRLSVTESAPVPAWRDPSDPRRAITVEQLMRMTSGLALDETNNGFDPSSRILYTEPDMAGFAESAAPRIA